MQGNPSRISSLKSFSRHLTTILWLDSTASHARSKWSAARQRSAAHGVPDEESAGRTSMSAYGMQGRTQATSYQASASSNDSEVYNPYRTLTSYLISRPAAEQGSRQRCRKQLACNPIGHPLLLGLHLRRSVSGSCPMSNLRDGDEDLKARASPPPFRGEKVVR
jgi:hypothetical protein